MRYAHLLTLDPLSREVLSMKFKVNAGGSYTDPHKNPRKDLEYMQVSDLLWYNLFIVPARMA
jgi:hypothetical protein